LRLGCAVLCGITIGIERQWRQRTAGLRTYTLVSVGSALFVVLASLTPSDSSPTRIAGQIVTGIGFLGAGVIMRSGFTVHALNSAANIWCLSAVGTLAGSGYYWPALVGSAVILAINTCLQPLIRLIDRQPVDPTEQEFKYSLKLTCSGHQETHLRALLVQLANVSHLVLHELESVIDREQNHTILSATLSCPERLDTQVEQLASRLSLEKNVVGIHWQMLPSGQKG
jgi:putative Mg2+ transporter-C (MgtC) family protein